jgi:hypothetical protein
MEDQAQELVPELEVAPKSVFGWEEWEVVRMVVCHQGLGPKE